MVCVSVCVCISQGTSTGSNCNSALLAAVTIGCNLSEPSFALVYVGITPHTLWGGLKRTSSDTAGVQALTKTRLWFICCVCCVFLKRDIYLHVGTCTAFYPTVIASRSIWHYNNGQPRRILLLSGPHTHTHSYAEKEALAGSRCMSLTVDDLDWGIEIIMQYFSQRGASVSTSLAYTAAAHYFAALLSALNDPKWAWDFSRVTSVFSKRPSAYQKMH